MHVAFFGRGIPLSPNVGLTNSKTVWHMPSVLIVHWFKTHRYYYMYIRCIYKLHDINDFNLLFVKLTKTKCVVSFEQPTLGLSGIPRPKNATCI
jgi:hypothetical protein